MTVKTKVKAKGGNAQAAQVGDGTHEAVAIWNLSVLIVPDENYWFAQGLEINYGAQGGTVEEAKENFENGLLATIHQHMKVYGHIKGILKFAPNSVLGEAAKNKDSIQLYAQVSLHNLLDETSKRAMPFDGIDYRVQTVIAA